MRTPLLFAVLAAAVFSSGCVRQKRVSAVAQPSVWDRQIKNAADAGDGDYQLRALRQKVAVEPDSIPARLALINAYRERGYPDFAIEMCRITAARFPASGEVQLELVKSLRDLNQRPEAIASLQAFVDAHPAAGAEYFSWLGILRDETGDYAAGETAHRKALELAPSADYLHNNLGYNLLMQKKDVAAADEFRAALKLNPASQMARNNLGMALAGQNANAQAVADWQTGADPATAHNNLAAVLIEKGDYAGARKELQIALSYNKSLPAALRNLELVSRLDGTGVAQVPRQTATRWERLKVGFVRLFVGPLDDTH